jgi:alpha-amylase
MTGWEGQTREGSDYTGYWVSDLTTVNANFGTEEDLLALSKEIHLGISLPSEGSN